MADYYSTLEASRQYDVPADVIWKACNSGELASTPGGGDFLVATAALETFLESVGLYVIPEEEEES